MRRSGASKGTVFPPSSCDIVKVALPYGVSSESGTASHGFDGHFIQALALLTCPASQNGVEAV